MRQLGWMMTLDSFSSTSLSLRNERPEQLVRNFIFVKQRQSLWGSYGKVEHTNQSHHHQIWLRLLSPPPPIRPPSLQTLAAIREREFDLKKRLSADKKKKRYVMIDFYDRKHKASFFEHVKNNILLVGLASSIIGALLLVALVIYISIDKASKVSRELILIL